MDVAAILRELQEERDAVEQAILSIERLAAGQTKRRGRPPGWMKQIGEIPDSVDAPKRKRGRRPKSKMAE
jgi:hypothetical protein